MSLFRLFAVLGPLLATRVAAQGGSTTAVCTYAQWTFNALGESPCAVWAALQAACDSNAVVGKLDTSANPTAKYPNPSGSSATPCQCNFVAYNLMAGCSWCQPDVYTTNWDSEATWKAGCSTYNSTGLPSQASSLSNRIPKWALLQDTGDKWDEFDASSVALGGATPTTGFRSATGTAAAFTTARFTTRTRGASSPTFTVFSGGDDFEDIGPDVGKAVGIAVGIILAVYAVIGGIVLAVFFVRQKNRKAWYGPTAQYYRNGGRMADADQPLLAGNKYAGNTPDLNYSPSGTPGAPNTSPYNMTQYQSTSPPPGQYGQNTNFASISSPVGQYDQGMYGQGGYQPSNAYYDPNSPHPPPMPHAPHHVPQL